MKTSFCFSRIVSVVAAVAMATGALAQPPPGGVGSPGPGRPGSGYPLSLGRIVLPPPEPPPPRRHHYRSYGYFGDSTVVRVQRALKSRGYYPGPIDGDAGPGTRGAIRSFRRQHGLESTSRIDGVLLRALGL